tara:strand:- start:140 stop:883 length:744 start_codon:yes stop_codon:yes gene_type:complete
MLKKRLIPSLLIKNNKLVKTIEFKNPSYVGDPLNAIRIFNEKEVDEIIVIDIDASIKKNKPNYDLIHNIASECFMPLCYGGGINELDVAKTVFDLGVEKICLQSIVLKNYKIIDEISKIYGSQSVVISIDIKKNFIGKYKLYSRNKNLSINIDWKKHIYNCIEHGAGEFLINSVDKDGTLSGLDLNLIKETKSVCSVPFITIGGVNSIEDAKKGISKGADAIAAGSFFIYHGPHRAVLITYPTNHEL